jgi:hypothetical protein
MFVAFPDPTGRNGDPDPVVSNDPPVITQPERQVTAPAPQTTTPPVTPPPVAPRKDDTADRLAPGPGDPPVPDPNRDLAERTAPAAPTPKEAREGEQSLAPPKQEKVAKRFVDKLPREPDVAPPPKAVATEKRSRPKEDIVSRTIITKREVRVAAKRNAERVVVRRDVERSDEGLTKLVRRTTEVPPAWRRTHNYECTGGRCDCDCDRPYWARSGDSPCWD